MADTRFSRNNIMMFQICSDMTKAQISKVVVVLAVTALMFSHFLDLLGTMEILTCDISSSKLSSFAICCSSCGSPAGQIFPTRSITEASLSMSEDWLSNNWPSEGEIQLHNLHVNTIIYFPSCPLLLRIYIFVLACSKEAAPFFPL
uniref:Uncharacterized protein n=2 Tax=Aegilops tauschii subsp. strangulata TaxID=200361 RepID=A0A453P2B1_AEGTS